MTGAGDSPDADNASEGMALPRRPAARKNAMHRRLLAFLRCPECDGALELSGGDPGDAADEVEDGLLRCTGGHHFPITRGVPRMLSGLRPPDERTSASFSHEWQFHQVGDSTWGMSVQDRVRCYFLEPLRIPVHDLEGKVLLDAGCGNGSQSIAYTEFGLEVIAVDLSSGVDRGQDYRGHLDQSRRDRVHFVQGDLQAPPLAAGSVDIIHSAGVLHHTPDTEQTFRRLCSLVKPGGTFYVWLYKYEPVVTPIVNGIRQVTTKLPSTAFTKVANGLASPFILFCRSLDRLGVRSYPTMTRREAALAVIDIFGAPYAHNHSYPEVVGWYESEGFDEVWPCNDDRRGFGVCGRKAG